MWKKEVRAKRERKWIKGEKEGRLEREWIKPGGRKIAFEIGYTRRDHKEEMRRA